MFDWIPTLEEVIDWVDCRIVGHTWVRIGDAEICKQCRKVRS